MPAQIITARAEGGQFVVRVHLDTTKEIGSQDARQPDPDWVFEERHPLDCDPQEATRKTLIAAKKRLKELNPPAKATPFPGRFIEGQTLDLATLKDAPPPARAPTEAEAQQPHPHQEHARPQLDRGDEESAEHPGTGAPAQTAADRTRAGMPTKDG